MTHKRIDLAGLQGEVSVSELRRREGVLSRFGQSLPGFGQPKATKPLPDPREIKYFRT